MTTQWLINAIYDMQAASLLKLYHHHCVIFFINLLKDIPTMLAAYTL